RWSRRAAGAPCGRARSSTAAAGHADRCAAPGRSPGPRPSWPPWPSPPWWRSALGRSGPRPAPGTGLSGRRCPDSGAALAARGSSGSPPPQLQAEPGELLLHFVQRLPPEVLHVDDFLFGLLEQIAQGVDPRALQAVVRPDGEVELLDRHRRDLARLVRLRAHHDLGAGGGAHEEAEAVDEQPGGLLQRFLRPDA